MIGEEKHCMENERRMNHCNENCIAQWSGVCVVDKCEGPYLMHPFPKSPEQAKKAYWLVVKMFREDFGGSHDEQKTNR